MKYELKWEFIKHYGDLKLDCMSQYIHTTIITVTIVELWTLACNICVTQTECVLLKVGNSN